MTSYTCEHRFFAFMRQSPVQCAAGFGRVSMEQNVKKKSAHNIYYGIEQKTGSLKHISEVPSGMECACNCTACGTALEARKGKIRRHHFAHVSNYDCMYADEIAIYKACAEIISKTASFYLPPIYLYLNPFVNLSCLNVHSISRPTM